MLIVTGRHEHDGGRPMFHAPDDDDEDPQPLCHKGRRSRTVNTTWDTMADVGGRLCRDCDRIRARELADTI